MPCATIAFSASASEAMLPEQLDPAEHERGAKGCRREHYFHRFQRLIPVGRQTVAGLQLPGMEVRCDGIGNGAIAWAIMP